MLKPFESLRVKAEKKRRRSTVVNDALMYCFQFLRHASKRFTHSVYAMVFTRREFRSKTGVSQWRKRRTYH
jgi:hypothetical protein